MHLNHSLLFLKSPLVFNGDSIPPRRLTQPECALTAAALHPSLLSFILFLCPPIPSSVFYLLSLLTVSSLPEVLFLFFPLSSFSDHHFSSHRPYSWARACGTCADWSLLGRGRRFFFFFLLLFFIFILSVQVEHRREGKQHPGPPDQYLLRIWGDLGTDLLLQLFPSCLSVVVFEFFFKIATSGMLNKDWWMFPNCVSLTLSATTTSRCFFIQIPFFPSWLAHLNFSVSL